MMGQPAPPQWWEVIVGMLSIPATIFGIISSFYVVQKATLEKQKLRLEMRKLELEVLEKEIKLQGKKKLPNKSPSTSVKSISDNKIKSMLEKFLFDIQSVENRITNSLMGLLSPFKVFKQEKSTVDINIQRTIGSVLELIFLLLFLYASISEMVTQLVLIYPQIAFPYFFDNFIVIEITSSIGAIMISSLAILDLRGVTNLTSWADLRGKNKTFIKIWWAILITSVVVSILSSPVITSDIYQVNLIKNMNIPFIALMAYSSTAVYVVPTTILLFNGTQGILVIITLPLVLLLLLITVLHKFVAKIIYYASD